MSESRASCSVDSKSAERSVIVDCCECIKQQILLYRQSDENEWNASGSISLSDKQVGHMHGTYFYQISKPRELLS